MKCPCCGRAMQRGYFRNSTQPIQWIPAEKKPSVWKSGVAEGAVVLGDGGYWTGYRAEACYCPFCKLVIVPEAAAYDEK